ncbi:copper transporter family protein [Aspergillus candidus]|uniref:Copper transport protein n=1 Tax=Aspergillus candidus TaxID=41067 RepID=A0A2I2F897_ASPCN|nr:hypothetical protein BDW47DRAFT_107797 [Aspergillus candidus]PLB36843.1 hypothetical protein BDW47DRAFT_107797 [Aspergillus candidus]
MDHMDMTTTDMDSMSKTMSMPSATSTSMGSMGGMGGMDHGDSMSKDGMSMPMYMSEMAMTFFTSTSTPLYSNSWAPTNRGQYAGTCIFLIALAVIFRVLLALRPILEARYWSNRPAPLSPPSESSVEKGVEVREVPAEVGGSFWGDIGKAWSGWRVNSAGARATYDLIVAGVGYLL